MCCLGIVFGEYKRILGMNQDPLWCILMNTLTTVVWIQSPYIQFPKEFLHNDAAVTAVGIPLFSPSGQRQFRCSCEMADTSEFP